MGGLCWQTGENGDNGERLHKTTKKQQSNTQENTENAQDNSNWIPVYLTHTNRSVNLGFIRIVSFKTR